MADAIDRSQRPSRAKVASSLKRLAEEVAQEQMAVTSDENLRFNITNPNDGPVTDFVLIMRALEQVKDGADTKTVGNILYEELEDRGFLKQGYVEPSGEFPEPD